MRVWKKGYRPNNGLHPTRLSQLDIETGLVIGRASEQKDTLQTRLAGEANR